MKKILLTVALLVTAFAVQAGELDSPRQVNNVTIYDINGNLTQLPEWGRKNLFIFFVDPDAYVGNNSNKDFSAELEKNGRAGGDNILGFGIINTADTKLPKGLIRNLCKKRCEKNNALILDDRSGTLARMWGLGNCDGKFMLMVVNKKGEIVYLQKEEITSAGKEEFYNMIEKYK